MGKLVIGIYLVEGSADRACHKLGSVGGSNGCLHRVCKTLLGGKVGNLGSATVAIRQENGLGIAVEINVPRNTFDGRDLGGESSQSLALRCIACSLALVVFRRGGSRGTARNIPMRRPVAVDVGTYGRDTSAGLSVLPPEAGGALTVGEAISIDDGDDVEIEVVQEGLGGAATVTRDQLVDDVLGDHRGDPLSRMDGRVVVNSRLGARTATSPQVNTSDGSPLKGLANGDYLRVGRECSLNILQPCQMVGIGMIGIEPRGIRESVGRGSYANVSGLLHRLGYHLSLDSHSQAYATRGPSEAIAAPRSSSTTVPFRPRA